MAATRLDNSLGRIEYDNLIYDLYPEREVFSVNLAAGEGILKRGTLLAKGDDGAFSIFETGKTANCILCDDTELGTEETIAAAYRTGHFAQNKLIVKEGTTLTEADKEALRDVGILLSESV